MNFNQHSNLEGLHALLSPSKYHWINYTKDKLVDYYNSYTAAQRGTELHDFACRCINLGIRLPRNSSTLNAYVNDAITYKLTPEQPLYFSENCFGTADAIGFNKDFLRIHDLKTGVTTASMHQLEVYEALFCLEYKVDPRHIGKELRIYQSDEVLYSTPEDDYILELMDKIVFSDKVIEELKAKR